jgi:hypothetical protein
MRTGVSCVKKSLVVSLCLAGLLPLAAAAQSVTPLAVNPVVLPTPVPVLTPIPAPAKPAGNAKSGSKAKGAKAGSAKRAGKVAAKVKPRRAAKKGR